MDGHRLARRSDRGRRFANELIATATEQARTWQPARLGPRTLRIGLRTEDGLAQLISGAFLPGGLEPADFTLAVARHGEALHLPPTDWAVPWIESGQPVPPEVTYPFRVFIDRYVGVAYALNQATGQAAVWIRRETELDLRSFITPFRVMLSWIADLFDAEVVHASATAVDGRGIAFSGASGSGKSTLAIGLGLAGHSFLSDDCLLVHGGVAHAVFARAKLDPTAAALVGVPTADLHVVPNTPRAKAYYSVHDLGSSFVTHHKLHAWGFPVLGRQPGHYRLSTRRAYGLLSVDSLREIYGGGPRNQVRLVRTIRDHPSHRLLLGPSMSENVEVVEAALDDRPWASSELGIGKVLVDGL